MHHVLVTGVPGVGKTTVCLKLLEALKPSCDVAGFVTEEVRSGSQRQGFDVVLIPSHQRVPLARLATPGVKGPRVGKYAVDASSIKNCVIPYLRELQAHAARKKGVILLDEIGKMELLCDGFESVIRELLDQTEVPVVSTIAMKGPGLIQEAKSFRNVTLFEVRRGTRDDDFTAILGALTSQLKV